MVTRETSLAAALSWMSIRASDQALRRLARLVELLENDAVKLGFVGPNEGQRVVSRHVLESAALLRYLPPDDPVVDVGSGAGLPGLVLAALGRRVVLIEAQAKRAAFLRGVGAELGVHAEVRQQRAEAEGRGDLRDAAGSVVARALAPPTVALELCLPLVRPGGRLLLPATPSPGWPAGSDARSDNRASSAGRTGEGASPEDVSTSKRLPASRGGSEVSAGRHGLHSAAQSEAEAQPGLAPAIEDVAELLGGGGARWRELSVPGVDAPRWVMMVDKRRPTPGRFPRRSGVPKRRPLGGDVASAN